MDSRGGSHHIYMWRDTLLRVVLNSMWHLVSHNFDWCWLYYHLWCLKYTIFF